MKCDAAMAAEIGRAVATAMADAQKSATPAGWKCQRADCLYAVKGWPNWPGRLHCVGCYYPKYNATHPPANARLEVTPKTTTRGHASNNDAEKELKKKEARARRKQARADFKKSKSTTNDAAPAKAPDTASEQPGPVALAMAKAEDVAPARRLLLPDEVLKAIPLLLPGAADEIIKGLQKETKPGQPETRQPEVVLAKFLGDKGPVARVAKRDELMADISRLKAGITAMSAGGEVAKGAVALLEQQLETAETTLAKLAKDSPSHDHEYKAICEAKSSYELSIQSRKDREARGELKAQERNRARGKFFRDLRDQITLLEQSALELVTTNNDKHLEKAMALSDLDTKVLELFDSKLKALEVAPLAPAAAANPGYVMPAGPGQGVIAPLALLPPVTAESNTLAELAAAKLKIAQIEEESRRAIEMLKEKVKEDDDKVHAEFNRNFDDALNHLPQVKIPEMEHLPAVGSLHLALQRWECSGASIPFDWESLKPIIGDKLDIVAVSMELMGPAWKFWYQAGNPAPSWVVPRQVALLLLHCLNDIKNSFANQDKDKANKAAQDGIQFMREGAKRLRSA